MKKLLSNMFWWVNHRTFRRFHIVKTGLKPGYYDKDDLMVYANFRLLVDYVEIELGGRGEIFNEDETPPFYKRIVNSLQYMFTEKRNRKAAMKYIHCAGNERDEHGNLTAWAKHYREVEELYTWWCNTYSKLVKEYDNTLSIDVEDHIEDEIDRQLVRLVNLRRGMWT